ncbi:MAG: hydroxypyruvate isomerase [Hyphomicrobiaceae bacterium]|nr:hydroxypyruvate isomerase [Hyphomicrobiaceae bacterium]
MPRFCANLSMLFTELPFLDRFEAAARAGFQGVEYLFPYEFDAAEIADRLATHGLTQVLFNMPPGDWAAGERGLAALPDRVDEFRGGIDLVVRYARDLGCRSVHCMAGIAPAGADAGALRATYVANLIHAADRLAQDGVDLLIEPINTRDMPGYVLTRTQQALDIIADVGRPNVRLQYDCYHMQIMEGDLCPTIERNLASIGHVQAADTPGRHEPGTGEINYPFVFAHLDRLGYAGWIGCEYRPRAATLDGLAWFSPYIASL